MMAQANGLTPLTELFERAKALGLSVDQGLWEKLVDAGFDLKVRRIGQHSYGVDRRTELYLHRIVEAKQRLSRHFQTSALAFELALNGDPLAPSDLVKREAKRRLSTFFGSIRRQMYRAFGVSARPGAVTRPAIKKASRRWARSITSNIQNPTVQVLATMGWSFFLARFLGFMYFHDDLRVNVRPLGELLAMWHHQRGWTGNTPVGHYAARDRAQVFADLIWGVRSVIVLDPAKNILFPALREAAPAAVAELTRLAAGPTRTTIMAMSLIASKFPITLSAGYWSFIEYHFPAIVVAMLAAYRHEPAARAELEKLRQGVDSSEQMIPIVRDVMSTFEGGATNDCTASAATE